ncbi:MAG: glycosyltransferase [Acidiferrobacteraceae bacterium]
MKVFLLQEIIPSYRVPVFRRLARLDGVDLTVFYSRPSKKALRENLQNSGNIQGFRHQKIGLWELGSCAYQFGILWHVLIGRPQVVITGGGGCLDRLMLLLLCRLLGTRILWFWGGVPSRDEKQIHEYANLGRLNRWFGKYNPKRLLMRQASGLIAYSEHAKRYYTGEGFSGEHIWVASNAPDTEALSGYREEWLGRQEELDAERRRFAPEGGGIIFLLGRLNHDRKADVLLRALQRIRDQGLVASLVIVGDGADRQRLEDMTVELVLQRVFFEGAIYDERALSKYFMIADVFVVPGVASLAIKMAMSFGTPVITVDFGLEVHDVEEGVNGFIVPMNDVDALSEKMRLLLNSAELRQRIGQNGFLTIRDRINIGRMIEGFRQAIFSEPPHTAKNCEDGGTDLCRQHNER